MLSRPIRLLLGAFLLGLLIGTFLDDADLAEALIKSFITVLDEHGLAVAISFMFVASAVTLVWYLLKQMVKSKDDEIKRLVRLRDELWDQYIKERPSSGAKNKP